MHFLAFGRNEKECVCNPHTVLMSVRELYFFKFLEILFTLHMICAY